MTKLLQTLDAWMSNYLEELHTAIPGRIEAYSGHGTRLARVLPMVRHWRQSGEVLDPVAIDDVPVIFPGSAVGGSLFPLAPGDRVLLVFAESGIGNYIHGRGDAPEDADDPSRFSLSDCIAIPGLFNVRAVPRSTAPADATWIGDHTGAYASFRKKLQLANASSTMRAELEALWDVVGDLYTKLATLAPISASPGSPSAPNPAQVTAINTAKADAQQRRAAVSDFLE